MKSLRVDLYDIDPDGPIPVLAYGTEHTVEVILIRILMLIMAPGAASNGDIQGCMLKIRTWMRLLASTVCGSPSGAGPRTLRQSDCSDAEGIPQRLDAAFDRLPVLNSISGTLISSPADFPSMASNDCARYCPISYKG